MLKKKINYMGNQHILNVDLLQKYRLSNINKIPSLKEISLLVNLNDFSNSKNISEEILQTYSFLILYSFGFMLPSIQMSKLTVNSTKNFNLKLSLKNRGDIETLLEYMFIYLIEKEEDIQKLKTTTWESNLDVCIPLTKNLNTNFNQQSVFNVNISFIFSKKELKKVFKQFAPFWVLKLNG